MQLYLENIPIEIVRKKIKNIYIHFKDGRITVSVPNKCPRSYIENLLNEKKSQLLQEWRRMAKTETPLELLEQSHYPIWGSWLPLIVKNGDNCQLIITESGIEMSLPGRDREDLAKILLLDWHKRATLARALELLPQWQARLKTPAFDLQVKKMKSRWGSCAPYKSKIVLNSLLSQKLPECLEYVLAHEMLHFFAPNHGQVFKNMLTSVLPDWETRKEKLHLPEGEKYHLLMCAH